jgi:hypothetical protein
MGIFTNRAIESAMLLVVAWLIADVASAVLSMNSKDITRRQFVTTASAASVSAVGPSLFGATAALAAPMVRKDVAGMTATSSAIVSYRKAIKVMKALHESDPCSWTYQAAMHATTITPALPTWNKCQHGTNLFWPWHRMYLYWFERIVRKMSGDATWTLPFWNWTSNPQIPSMFRDDPTSDLYVKDRYTWMNGGASLSATAVSYSTAFTFTDFNLTDTSFEGTPHGAVHVGVGGWMSKVPTAAQDPIFFLHHCNVDRLWDLWLAQGGGRTDPLSDATWTGAKFTFFDENCKEVVMSTCDVLSAANQLGYKYEGEPPQIVQSCAVPNSKALIVLAQLPLLEAPGTPVELGDDPVTVQFDVKATSDRLLSTARAKADALLLVLEGVEAETQPGVVWEVYVGAPTGAELHNPASPYYVGTLALFGAGIRDEAHHEFKPARFVFPISRAIAAAVRAQTGELSVMFVPTGAFVEGKHSKPPVAAKVHIGKASIVVNQQRAQ